MLRATEASLRCASGLLAQMTRCCIGAGKVAMRGREWEVQGWKRVDLSGSNIHWILSFLCLKHPPVVFSDTPAKELR